MKKFALASGLLFLVVYFWVNTSAEDDSSFEAVYPPMAVSTMVPAEMSDNNPVADPPSQNNETVEGSGAYIIVASFEDQEQAKIMAEAYTERYQAEIIVLPSTSGGHYRISYGSYSSAAEAKAALEILRETGFPDAWILTSR